MHYSPRVVMWLAIAGLMCATPRALVADDDLTLSVTFDAEPVQRGVVFDRTGVKKTNVKVEGKPMSAWASHRAPTMPNMGWMRSVQLRVTDERFHSGRMPAVDLTFRYMLDAWSGVQVFASTRDGWKQVGSGWGDTKGKWRTLKVRLDDAWFGPEQDGRGGQLEGGWDLMITGANAPLVLESVKIQGYDPNQNVRWARMLRLDRPQPVNHEDDTLFCFRRRADNAMSVEAVNLAFVERPLAWRLTVTGRDGEAVHDATGAITLPREASEAIRLGLDTRSWGLGPYRARLELRLDADDSEPVLTRMVRLGVVDDGPWVLPKAGDDEFFFGLDAGNAQIVDTGSAAAAAWYDLMGVDVLRSLPFRGRPDSREKLDAAVAFIERHQLRAMYHADPPKPNERDAKWRDAELQRRADLMAAMIAEHGGRGVGRIPFVELGNEPDLPFFWPGEIDSYVAAMNHLAAAGQQAKQTAGLSDADVLIANGGLSFAGATGDQRSRQMLKLASPDTLDAIAYHAHGPGFDSERHAYQRLRDAMAGTAVEGLPVFDTETGVSGTNEPGMIEQARTVVEKFVFAHTADMPTLLFFRLFMEGGGSEGGYGMTDDRTQPRPSVLAYRQMVRRLRGHRLVKVLDTDGSGQAPGTIACLYHAPAIAADHGADRWALVAFSTRPAQYELNLTLGPADAVVTDARVHDLFGNESQPRVMGGHIATVAVGVDPVFLTWTAATDAQAIALVPPLLQWTVDEALPTDWTSPITVTVRNPGREALAGRLRVTAVSAVPMQVSPQTATVSIAPGEAARVPVTVAVGEAAVPLGMPQWWRVFPDVDPGKVRDAQWAAMPASLPEADGRAVSGRHMPVQGQRLDFARLVGGFKEKRPIVGFAYLDSPTAVTLPVAASADWWMAWRVNGELVYSTLDTGNRHGSLADHTFELPLRAGRNVIAFACLSGSGGWSLDVGGPRERALALSAGTPPDRLEVVLEGPDGTELARRTAGLRLQGPVPPLGDVDRDDPAAWWALEPLAVLGAEQVTNRFAAEPDQTRWYRGEDDLSAVVWLRDDGTVLRLLVAVSDDEHQPAAAEGGEGGDRLHMVVTGATGELRHEGHVPSSDHAAPRRVTGPQGSPVTVYQLDLPADDLRGTAFAIALRITDHDGGIDKQTLDLGQVTHPATGLLLTLRPTP